MIYSFIVFTRHRIFVYFGRADSAKLAICGSRRKGLSHCLIIDVLSKTICLVGDVHFPVLYQLLVNQVRLLHTNTGVHDTEDFVDFIGDYFDAEKGSISI